MATTFLIPSSDPALLEKATQIAKDFVQPFLRDDVVGIVFLGAVARGYFDRSADIDVAIFTKPKSDLTLPKFRKVDGLEIQVWISDYESERAGAWDMPKRWTYSQNWIFFDPSGKISELIRDKVPLKPEERKWLMMSGLMLSEWYVRGLTALWVDRGNILSAHQMIDQGLVYFYDMLSGLNGQLVADMKWRYYCVEQLERLPRDFRDRIRDVLIVHSLSLEELERRKTAFLEMWEEMRPVVEQETRLTYDEMEQLV